ncbi:hypothetical protein [Pseudomonas oryzihabitans]|uniref:Uncharacterized protein n=1 Tax=Pseudomonas oryzihabitans TaxID=47885 RepID=A0A0U4WL00_9PSED|nr:hypothetical protein [Pseudomonas oryzihabitans]ALZ85100.1 hypothetical protein APT59_13190 [Pseudomonas oryzihabitans]
MRPLLLPLLLAPAILFGTPAFGQQALETDSDYLQQRAASLNERIDTAVKERQVSKPEAAKLHLAVGQVQTLAGHLQTRNGTISRPDADAMNQKLTDVERILTHQP